MQSIQYNKTKKGEWFFKIVAGNGKILCHSEGYKRKSSAKKAVNAIQKIFTSFDAAKEIKKVMVTS